MKGLIIFTDLDGTLLDHDNYSFEKALPALAELNNRNIPMVINSSKTAAEISMIRNELDNHHPFIVENGGAVCIPHGYFEGHSDINPDTGYSVHYFGPGYAAIRTALNKLRDEYGYSFRGFSAMSSNELAGLTGLSVEQAVLAQKRHCSEPLLWDDSESALHIFSRALADLGLTTVQGGRFTHVMGRVDKSEAMRWLMKRYANAWMGVHWTSVALGDSPNDRKMLEAADIAVVITAGDGNSMQIIKKDAVFRPQGKGPEGWNTAILDILKQTERSEH